MIIFGGRACGKWLPGVLLLFMILAFPLDARVYTTRPKSAANLENPESLGARAIYSGRFRINGHPAEMQIFAANSSVADILRLLEPNPNEARNDLRYRASRDTIIGAMGRGDSERRFLISSVGSTRSCLIFVLQGAPGFFLNSKTHVPWPDSLPRLDPLQQPQLVVEHLGEEFIFACVLVPQVQGGQVLQVCREQLVRSGWEVEPLTEKALSQMADSGFAVLSKKGKTCWMEAKSGSSPNQTCITLLCKAP